MLVTVALGGNALLRRGEPADAATQLANVRVAVAALAELAEHHELVVTHGNGPQVGLLALQGEAYTAVTPYPLDVLGAESEGMIGYLLEQELTNVVAGARVATLLTRVQVDPADPAFDHPTKPIGPVYDRATAQRLARERGWTVAPDGDHWRRVVPSPEPVAVVELETIRLLCEAGITVICAGGGGIPVAADGDGRMSGVEAVIDKDLSTALLAAQLGADALLLLTDVPAIVADWGRPTARELRSVSVAELRGLRFDAGSMGPKVDAACRFVEATSGLAGIGALADAAAILGGGAGTLVTPLGPPTPVQPS